MPRLVAAPDRFNGMATAPAAASAMQTAAEAAGWDCVTVPVSDGGEGILDVLGGGFRQARVRGPLGERLVAEYGFDGRTAVVEMARASGLGLVGGPGGNDAVRADTAGTGELIAAAVTAGARRVIVGTGGSATTDGGLGALQVLEPRSRLRGVELVVACDVATAFLDAAEAFAAAKGATPSQVNLLARRLERLAQVYEHDYGTDVRPLPGGGAGGGLAGGLAALGATLLPGFEVVAEATDLALHVEEADLVITGERWLDEETFGATPVARVCELGREVGTPVLVIVAEAVGGTPEPPVPCVCLTDRFGAERVEGDLAGCIREAVGEELARLA